jgi:hypothetical protein
VAGDDPRRFNPSILARFASADPSDAGLSGRFRVSGPARGGGDAWLRVEDMDPRCAMEA